MSFSPIVGQEKDVGGGNDDLQPPPVSDKVGEEREEEDANAEEHLVNYPNCASVLHPHNLCD